MFLFPNGTKSAFNKSGSDHARGKADAAHYQCPSLTTISYHPLLNYTATVPLALRELRVSFDQRGRGCFIDPLNRFSRPVLFINDIDKQFDQETSYRVLSKMTTIAFNMTFRVDL